MAEVLYRFALENNKIQQYIMSAFLFRRYVWLLDLIASRDGISHKEISKAWEKSSLNDYPGTPLPKRTLHNHIQAIEEMFDIKIESLRQAGYPYVIKNKENGHLSEMQESLITQLRMTNAMMGDSKLQGRVIMDRYAMWLHFTPLITAMNNGLAIRLTIRRMDLEDKDPRYFTIEPYFLKQFENWFLVGRVVEDGLIHPFALSSIKNIEILDSQFDYDKEFDVMGYIIDPPYNKPTSLVRDDSDLFILERGDDRIRRRSMDKPMYELSKGETDYADMELGLDRHSICIQLHKEQEYRRLHQQTLTLNNDYDFGVKLFCNHPDKKPFIIVDNLEELIRIEVAVEDGLLIRVISRYCEDKGDAIAQLLIRTNVWLDAPCPESRFNGTNREYVLWLWELLGM